MTEQPKPDRQVSGQGMHVDVDHLSVTGHVVFAGRDGTVQVNTGGDISQNSKNVITVGGVETTPDLCEQMSDKLEEVMQRFETEETDEDTKEAARHYFETIKKLLLSKKKPNPKILITTVKSLAKLGPIFAGGLAEVLGEPLAAQIIENLGKSTSGFFKLFMTKFGS